MRTQRPSLIDSQWIVLLNIGLYLLVVVVFVALSVLMWQMNQRHPLSVQAWIGTPLVFICPMVIGLSFRAHMGKLFRLNLMSETAAFACYGWITILLIFVYIAISTVADFR
jgi:hypothetical protein